MTCAVLGNPIGKAGLLRVEGFCMIVLAGFLLDWFCEDAEEAGYWTSRSSAACPVP